MFDLHAVLYIAISMRVSQTTVSINSPSNTVSCDIVIVRVGRYFM